MKFLLVTGVLFVLQLFPEGIYAQESYSRTLLLMGNRFDITVVADNQERGDKAIDLAIGEIKRIEKLISSWDPNSQTSNINRNSGIAPVKVDPELFGLIKRALAISKFTDGAFDITYASMDKIWAFDGSMKQMPSSEEITSSVSKVGYQQIVLNEEDFTVYLPVKGMKIGFGAIGKGYAADKAKQLLISNGTKGGIINASGDMNTWGSQANDKPWTVGIINPMNKEKVFATVPVKGAVVTSGNYEKQVIFDGVRYSHIINPKTGYPATGLISVTVFTSQAELADALATAVFVMGAEVGLDRINQIPDTECIIVTDKGELIKSNNINLDLK